MKYRVAKCCHHCRRWNALAPDERLIDRFDTWEDAMDCVNDELADAWGSRDDRA